MLKKMLFETAVGNWLLAALERATGLAIVDAEDLGGRRAPGLPAQKEARTRARASA